MPTNSPKLHLNENLSPRLARELRRYGFDIVSSQETDMLSASDVVQLAHAASEHRAILTFNIGELLRRILRLLNSVSADELKNQVRWLNEFK